MANEQSAVEDKVQNGDDIQSPVEDEVEEFMFDNAPIFSSFFQDALDQAASVKGISPKWFRNDDGTWQVILPPISLELERQSNLMQRKFPFLSLSKQSKKITGLLDRVLLLSRGGSHGASPGSVAISDRAGKMKDGGGVSGHSKTQTAPIHKPLQRRKIKTGTQTSITKRQYPCREYLRRLTGDETIGRLYSEHTGQNLRLRSFHELSHERTERLSQQIREKSCGKRCNQPEARFLAINATKINQVQRIDDNTENQDGLSPRPTLLTNSRSSGTSNVTDSKANNIRWRSEPKFKDGNFGVPSADSQSRKSGLKKTSNIMHAATGDAIFKMPAQSADSKCKEWILKHSKLFLS